MPTKLKYIDSFRNSVVKMVLEQGQEVTNVARQMGISNALLNSWIDDRLNMLDNGDLTLNRFRKIRQENRELKRQNDLLKKVIDHLNQLHTTR